MVLPVDGRQGPNNNEYPSHIKFITNSFSRDGQINVRFSEWRQDLQVMAVVVVQVEGKFMNMVTKKRYLHHVARIKSKSIKEGASWGFFVVGPKNKQTMVYPFVEARKQEI
jgi:hypothetical protein